MFRVFVTDGINSTSDGAAAGALPNHPPTVDIIEPNASFVTIPEYLFNLSANVKDPDGDPLTIRWFADTPEKELGTIRSVAVRTCESGCPLSLGTHTITVQVSDREFTVEDQVQVTVPRSALGKAAASRVVRTSSGSIPPRKPASPTGRRSPSKSQSSGGFD